MNIIIPKYTKTFSIDNVDISPYFSTLYNTDIGYDYDEDGNAIVDIDYGLEEITAYVEYCNTGYIDPRTFNIDLYEYMGHECEWKEQEDYLRLRLQQQWKNEYGSDNMVPYASNSMLTKDIINVTKYEILHRDLDELFHDVQYILKDVNIKHIYQENTVFVFYNGDNNSDTIHYNTFTYKIIYVNPDTYSPLEFIKDKYLTHCYYNGYYYYDTNIHDSVIYFGEYYIDNINLDTSTLYYDIEYKNMIINMPQYDTWYHNNIDMIEKFSKYLGLKSCIFKRPHRRIHVHKVINPKNISTYLFLKMFRISCNRPPGSRIEYEYESIYDLLNSITLDF